MNEKQKKQLADKKERGAKESKRRKKEIFFSTSCFQKPLFFFYLEFFLCVCGVVWCGVVCVCLVLLMTSVAAAAAAFGPFRVECSRSSSWNFPNLAYLVSACELR